MYEIIMTDEQRQEQIAKARRLGWDDIAEKMSQSEAHKLPDSDTVLCHVYLTAGEMAAMWPTA